MDLFPAQTGHGLLSDNAKLSPLQLPRQNHFVDRLKQPWSQRLVNFHCRIHDLPSYFIFFHLCVLSEAGVRFISFQANVEVWHGALATLSSTDWF